MPEATARNFLEEIGINELPIIPKLICEQLEIIYVEQVLKSIDGMLIIDERGNGLISINSLIPERGRKHFTGAHELGHFCMDSLEQKEFCCTREDIENFRKEIQPMELRANRFAAELLMPALVFQDLINDRDPDWDYIKDLAEMCQTSLSATAKRIIDLTANPACVLIVSKNGVISSFHPSKTFKAYIDMDSRVLSASTIAHRVHQGQMPPNNYEVVKADNWVSGRGVNAQTEILEWTLPMNSYGQVLTILLDEDGIAGWEKPEDQDYEEDECSSDWEPPTFRKSKRKR